MSINKICGTNPIYATACVLLKPLSLINTLKEKTGDCNCLLVKPLGNYYQNHDNFFPLSIRHDVAGCSAVWLH